MINFKFLFKKIKFFIEKIIQFNKNPIKIDIKNKNIIE